MPASTVRFPRYGRDRLCAFALAAKCGERGALQARMTYLHSVSAAMAKGKRPAPFRTRKLSPSAPMVLRGRLRGRVGRRRAFLLNGPPLGVARCVLWQDVWNSHAERSTDL
jgi:hypothetical protein